MAGPGNGWRPEPPVVGPSTPATPSAPVLQLACAARKEREADPKRPGKAQTKAEPRCNGACTAANPAAHAAIDEVVKYDHRQDDHQEKQPFKIQRHRQTKADQKAKPQEQALGQWRTPSGAGLRIALQACQKANINRIQSFHAEIMRKVESLCKFRALMLRHMTKIARPMRKE